VHLRDLHSDVLGCDTFDVVYESLADLLVILISYQTARDLSICLGGKDSLRTFALVSTPNTADIEGRTATITLKAENISKTINVTVTSAYINVASIAESRY